MQKKSSFTLLEMLVVLGIIAVVVAIGAISFATAQKKSRDARRKTDLKSIQNAMEQYYSVCGNHYPPIPTGDPIPTIGCSTVDPTLTILNTQLKDPRTGTGYVKTGGDSSYDSYTICIPTKGPINGSFYYYETEATTVPGCINNQQ